MHSDPWQAISMITPRFDGWKTLAKDGLGGVLDKARGLHYEARPGLTRKQLEDLYKHNALVARVVDLIVDEALKKPWAFKNVKSRDGSTIDPEQLRDRLEDFAPAGQKFDGMLATGAKWSRLFGGALLVAPTADGRRPDQPLAAVVQRLAPLVPVPSYDAEPLNYDAAIGSATFRQVLRYRVNMDQMQLRSVHSSRVIRFDPIHLPEEVLCNTGGLNSQWGHSAVERMYDDLAGYGAAKGHSLSQLFVSSLLFLKMTGYRKEASEKGGRELLRKLMHDFSRLISSQRVAPLDKEDDVTSIQNMSPGASAVTGDMRDGLGAVVDMPREIFFNESTTGLNGGEMSGPQKIWFSKVEAFQSSQLEPAIKQAVEIGNREWGLPLESFEIEWPALWAPTSTEVATIGKLNAETDDIYFQMASIDEGEVRTHRHVKGKDTPLSVAAAGEAQALDLGEGEPLDLAAAVGAPPQAEALSDTQVSSLLAIVEKVAAGAIARDSGIAIVRAMLPAQAAQAEALLGAPPPAPEAGLEAEADALAPSAAPPPADLMSPRDAATQLGLPTRAITLAIDRGLIPFWGIGNHKRISLADVMTLGKQHEQAAEDPPPGELPEGA